MLLPIRFEQYKSQKHSHKSAPVNTHPINSTKKTITIPLSTDKIFHTIMPKYDTNRNQSYLLPKKGTNLERKIIIAFHHTPSFRTRLIKDQCLYPVSDTFFHTLHETLD